MGNALFVNWSDTQTSQYFTLESSSMLFSIAIGVILTHYAVSEWIWKCIMKEKRHNSPVLIISLLMCWVLYLCFSGFYTGIYITSPVLAFLGWLVNLAFSAVWYHVQNRKATMPNAGEVGDASTALTSPLLEEEERADQPVQDDVETPTTIIETTTQPPAKKTTVDYINNIKIFLTCMVILQHCFTGEGPQGLRTMASRGEMGWGLKVLEIFIGMNDSYFMSLFFFYSGYFVPKSYDKKGRYVFLFDRMKRLGIPFVVFTFFLGPYVEHGFRHLFFGTPFPVTPWTPGQCWFLNQLMMFGVIYALACGKDWSPKIACPSLLGFFAIGTIIGIATGILLMFFPEFLFMMFWAVPSFWRDFLSYPIFFFAGAIAQRNSWMESIKEMSRLVIYGITVASWFVYYPLLFKVNPGYGGAMSPTLWAFLNGLLLKGIMGMFMSLSVTVFFMDYGNKKYFCTRFFSDAMYTAYIIHVVFPLLVGQRCFLSILDATGNLEYLDPSNPSIANAYIANPNLVFPGWLLISVITLVITWPLAYAIYSIPGFSQVL